VDSIAGSFMTGTELSLKVRNYKCFGDQAEGFETLKSINIIIGRNNSGKSALLDAVQQACKDGPAFRAEDSQPGTTAAIVFSRKIDERSARVSFPENTSSGAIPGGNYWSGAGIHYVGSILTFEQTNGAARSARRVVSNSLKAVGLIRDSNLKNQLETNLAANLEVPLSNKLFRRLAAERNIVPEGDSNTLDPQPSGQNVTNLIQNYSNLASLDRAVVDVKLLDALNSITAPDYMFTSITPRKLQTSNWEIFLNEKEKGLIALSASGSGLKTILCALANLVVWPIHERQSLDRYVFGFEELENSLHPALLRRLLLYISKRIREEDSCIFLTTHSSVAIDMFAGDPEAQIVHTHHRTGEPTKVITVSEYLHKRDVLDQLDVRASDLLQSNGIIWVEGPSDRTLINHWIGLVANQTLREGTHYQCVFYGGRLLAHLSADDPGEVDNLVAIFRVNRNAAVVIDSDRRSAEDAINATKQRIINEIAEMDGMAWVTAGREIENYLPGSAVANAEGLAASVEVGQFQDISESLEAAKEGLGKRFERKKTEFAARVVEFATLESMSNQLDWRARVDELCSRVRKWNRIPADPIGGND
jgi:putative ATP-dependent endonuclease of OLD family